MIRGLLSLPDELQLAILAQLDDPKDLASVSATCSQLHVISTSDECWRYRVEELVRKHLEIALGDKHRPWKAQDSIYKNYVCPTLGRGAPYLGWWASTLPYRGRLLRCSVQTRLDGSLAIIGDEVTCANAYMSEDPVRPWKPATAVWHGAHDLAYHLPVNHPSPDAGYSVDVFCPELRYTPIFAFTPEEDFTLFSSSTRAVPISAPLRRSFKRTMNCAPGHSEEAAVRYSNDQGPSFPSHDAVRGGILRSLQSWDSSIREEVAPFSGGIEVVGRNDLIAPAFTLKAKRDGSQPAGHSPESQWPRNVIYQTRPEMPQAGNIPILLTNPGGNQLFRAFLEGIGAVLPSAMQDTLFNDTSEDEEHEYFYPIQGPLRSTEKTSTPTDKPVLASSLKGLWVGGYSTHGNEFGIITLRNVWTRVHTADEVALEQIYDADQDDAGNADPSVAREPLGPSLEGLRRRRRTILEFIKITGDVNVPAGQVSWAAILPGEGGDHQSPFGTPSPSPREQTEPNLNTLTVPSVLRSDWQRWSDLPPSLARRQYESDTPRWQEGTVQAAGRIAFTGFVDTRFVDAAATFMREDNGDVDEIRVRWHEMASVSISEPHSDMANCADYAGKGILLQEVPT